MVRQFLALALAGLVAGFAAIAPAAAAEGPPPPPREKWSFAGPFGKFDRGQLQRGFKVYREVCQVCHGMTLLSFRNLSEPGGPEFSVPQVRTIASEYKVQDGPNDAGEMFERNGRAGDRFPRRARATTRCRRTSR
jgi:cytochrome c1